MLQSSHKDFRRKRRNPAHFNAATRKPTQHGCLLLDVPGEILSAITANLDPPALLALGECHVTFSKHVEDDTTWRIAFQTNLGAGLLLRRAETTWRKEYVNRHRTLMRFSHSRIPSTTHSPLPAAAISHIHLLSTSSGPTGLLSLSMSYGIIARSIPFTGRILPGFLDATGSTTGNGNGNPNAEFTPNISACAIASAGGTVRILWGYRTGHISFMVTNRTLEHPRRPAQEFRVSQEDERHHGTVVDLTWISDSDLYAASASSDGRVKVWDYTDHNTPDLIWTPSRPFATLAEAIERPVPCVKVVGNRTLGMVVCIRKDGSADIWHGFNFQTMNSDGVRFVTALLPGSIRTDVTVLALHIDPSNGDVLVALRGEGSFYRVRTFLDNSVIAYGAPEGGAILSSLQPQFTSVEGESSFVLTGDNLGCINVFDWRGEAPPDSTVRPMQVFQASTPVNGNQESITALAWTPAILATGTSAGAVVVWDSLTFEQLRVIVRPVGLRTTRRRFGQVYQLQPPISVDEDTEAPSSAVKQILVGEHGDALMVNVGGEVIAWRAGDVSAKIVAKSPLKGGKLGLPSRRGGSTISPGEMKKVLTNTRVELAESTGRWSEEIETKKMIADSQSDYQRQRPGADVQRSSKKKDIKSAQESHLQKLGLSEGEALEYALMLSREGDISPRTVAGSSAGSGATLVDDSRSSATTSPNIGAGGALTDEQLQAVLAGGLFSNSTSSDTSAAANLPVTPIHPANAAVSLSRISEGSMYEQVQGVLDVGIPSSTDLPITDPIHDESTATLSYPADLEVDFPAIVSRPEISVRTSLRQPPPHHSISTFENEGSSSSPSHFASLLPVSGVRRRESMSSAVSTWSSGSGASDTMRQNAWSRPLNAANFIATSPGSVPSSNSNSTRPGGDFRDATGGGGFQDLDEDLRYALELSLAEARSRGDDV